MCGIFGFVNYGKDLKGAEKLLEYLAVEASVRGTDATGYSYNYKGQTRIDKDAKAAWDMKYLLPKGVTTVMGHTRATTQGSADKNYNNHPFLGKHGGKEFSFAHNGVLYNEFEVREDFGITPNHIQTDSYVACQLMEKLGDFSMDNLIKLGESIEGMFVFTFLDSKNNLHIVRNDNPITLLHFPTLQLYVYASTDEILFNALSKFKVTKKIIQEVFLNGDIEKVQNIEIPQQSIMQISRQGKLTTGKFTSKERSWSNYNWNWGGYHSIYSRDYTKSNTVTTDTNLYKDYSLDMVFGDIDYYTEIMLKDAMYMGLTEWEFFSLVDLYGLDFIEEYLYNDDIFDLLTDSGL